MPRDPNKKPNQALAAQNMPLVKKALSVQGGYYSDTLEPSVMFESENGQRHITIETAYAFANALYIGAGYAEADGFIMYMFKNLGSSMPKEAKVHIIKRLRDSRRWPPPLYDNKIQISYGYGDNTNLPFVQFVIDGHQRQITAEAARDLAHGILLAAENARNDTIVMDCLKTEMGTLPAEIQSRIMDVYTIYREDIKKAQREHDSPTVSSA